MKTVNNIFTGILVGVLLGLWIGVNIGKGRPMFSNPFAEEVLGEKVKQVGDKIGEKLEEAGKSLKEN